MSNTKFDEDERMAVAIFTQPTRMETLRYMAEAVPYVEDDTEAFSLVAATMKKLQATTDEEFAQMRLSLCAGEAVEA